MSYKVLIPIEPIENHVSQKIRNVAASPASGQYTILIIKAAK